MFCFAESQNITEEQLLPAAGDYSNGKRKNLAVDICWRREVWQEVHHKTSFVRRRCSFSCHPFVPKQRNANKVFRQKIPSHHWIHTWKHKTSNLYHNKENTMVEWRTCAIIPQQIFTFFSCSSLSLFTDLKTLIPSKLKTAPLECKFVFDCQEMKTRRTIESAVIHCRVTYFRIYCS